MPAVDTVLFLRPTESATVFLQQLGRGLRLSDDKACLTVLDFIGQQHAKFRFDRRYRAITGPVVGAASGKSGKASRSCPPAATSSWTPSRGTSCSRTFEVTAHVLAGHGRRAQVLGADPLLRFLEETMLDLEDLYSDKSKGWTRLQETAGLRQPRIAGRCLARLPAPPAHRRSRAPRSDRATGSRGLAGHHGCCVDARTDDCSRCSTSTSGVPTKSQRDGCRVPGGP